MSEKHIKAGVEVYKKETGFYLPLTEEERVFLAITFWFWIRHNQLLFNPEKPEHQAWYEEIEGTTTSVLKELVFFDANTLGAFISYLFSGYALGLNNLEYSVVMHGERSGRQEFPPQVTLIDETGQERSPSQAMKHLYSSD